MSDDPMDNPRNTESDGFFYEEFILILMIQFNSLNPTDHGKSIDKPIRTRVIMTPLMLLPLTQTSLLWVTEETPADNSGQGDAADQEIGIPPPLQGSIFRVVEFKPENEDSGTEEAEFLRVVGTEQPENARHPGMHRTRSVDYAVIMSGEIDLLLDDDEVHLKAGDVVVQRGTNHAWVNRGTEPCAMAFVLLDAKEIG